MIEHRKIIEYKEFKNSRGLDSEWKSLLKLAEEASTKAYAPYSAFRVGAALLLENKLIVTANNQENAAYPSGLCAERIAMFSASANHPGVKFLALAIYASAEFDLNKPVSPCGACCQVMVEYENLFNSNITIVLGGSSGKVFVLENTACLLPFAFHEERLRMNFI